MTRPGRAGDEQFGGPAKRRSAEFREFQRVRRMDRPQSGPAMADEYPAGSRVPIELEYFGEWTSGVLKQLRWQALHSIDPETAGIEILTSAAVADPEIKILRAGLWRLDWQVYCEATSSPPWGALYPSANTGETDSHTHTYSLFDDRTFFDVIQGTFYRTRSTDVTPEVPIEPLYISQLLIQGFSAFYKTKSSSFALLNLAVDDTLRTTVTTAKGNSFQMLGDYNTLCLEWIGDRTDL